MNAEPLARAATAALADLSGGDREIGAGYNPERQQVTLLDKHLSRGFFDRRILIEIVLAIDRRAHQRNRYSINRASYGDHLRLTVCG